MALIRYQLLPVFGFGQVVLQCEPLTVATTVTLALTARWVRTVADVDGPVRTFTPEHAGIIVLELAALVGDATKRSPPTTPRRAARSQTTALEWDGTDVFDR